MKIFLILCACAVVSSAPYSDQEEAKALLEKMRGEHHLGKRLFFHSMVHSVEHAVETAVKDVGHVVESAATEVRHAAGSLVDGVETVVKEVGHAAGAVVHRVESVVQDIAQAFISSGPVVGLPFVILRACPESEVQYNSHPVTSDILKEALQNLGHSAGAPGTSVLDFRQATVDLLHGVKQVCNYVAQAAGNLPRHDQTGLQCVPVVPQTAADVVQVYFATFQASGALEQPNEEECREVIMAFTIVQGK